MNCCKIKFYRSKERRSAFLRILCLFEVSNLLLINQICLSRHRWFAEIRRILLIVRLICAKLLNRFENWNFPKILSVGYCYFFYSLLCINKLINFFHPSRLAFALVRFSIQYFKLDYFSQFLSLKTNLASKKTVSLCLRCEIKPFLMLFRWNRHISEFYQDVLSFFHVASN